MLESELQDKSVLLRQVRMQSMPSSIASKSHWRRPRKVRAFVPTHKFVNFISLLKWVSPSQLWHLPRIGFERLPLPDRTESAFSYPYVEGFTLRVWAKERLKLVDKVGDVSPQPRGHISSRTYQANAYKKRHKAPLAKTPPLPNVGLSETLSEMAQPSARTGASAQVSTVAQAFRPSLTALCGAEQAWEEPRHILGASVHDTCPPAPVETGFESATALSQGMGAAAEQIVFERLCALEMRLQDMEAKCGHLESRCANVESKNQELEQRLRVYRLNQSKAIKAHSTPSDANDTGGLSSNILPVGPESSLEKVLQSIQNRFPERLEILPSAVESARQSKFRDADKVYKLLFKLGSDYFDVLMAGGAGDAEARKVFGSRKYASNEGSTLGKKGKKARTFHWNEKAILMEKHLKIGNKDSSTETLRIHFEWMASQKRLIIGHCGEHLPFD